jgi:hypothetical protein
MSFKLLLLFCIQLLTDILRHIIMRLQRAPLRHMSDQGLQLVRSQLIVLLSVRIPPAVRPEVARWARAAHQIIYILPDRRLTGRSFLGIDLKVSFGTVASETGFTSSAAATQFYPARKRRSWQLTLRI